MMIVSKLYLYFIIPFPSYKVAIQMGSKIRLLHLHSRKLENRMMVQKTKPRRSYQQSSCRSFKVLFVKFGWEKGLLLFSIMVDTSLFFFIINLVVLQKVFFGSPVFLRDQYVPMVPVNCELQEPIYPFSWYCPYIRTRHVTLFREY